MLRPVGEQPGTAHQHGVPVDDALDAEPFDVGEVLGGGQLARALGGASGDRLGDGVLGGVLKGSRQAKYARLVLALREMHVGQGHLAFGDRAGLVEHDGVDRAGGFQDLGPLDQNAELGSPARTDQQRGRGGQAEGAGAGDDQYGHRGGERGADAVSGAEPETECAQGQRDHDRDEDPGDAVGQPLHLSLAGLRLLHQLGHLGEPGVGADAGGADEQAAAGVDGRAGDRVAGPYLDRDRFAGEHRGVDRGGTLLDHAVGGDLLAGPYDESVARGKLVAGDADLDAVAQHGDVLGAELQQGPQRGAGAALGAGLEVAPGQDERGHPGGGLQVDVA